MTVAALAELRRAAIHRSLDTDETVAYQDALQKSPRLIVVAHLALAAAHLLTLAGRVARRGIAGYARTWSPRADVRDHR